MDCCGRHVFVQPISDLLEKFPIKRALLMFADGFQPGALRRHEIKAVSHAGEFDIRSAAGMEAVDVRELIKREA